MKLQPLSELYSKLDQKARIKLSNVMRLTLEGSDKVLMSPPAERIGEQNVQSKWIEFYSSLDKSGWPDALIDMEDRQIEKIGPRSLQKPWSERKESTFLTFQPSVSNASCEMTRSPFKSVNFRKLRPASQATSLKFIKKSTSSGAPFMEKKGEVLDKSVNQMSLQNLGWAAVLYTRTQEQRKTRDVWGMSLFNVIFETPFFLPLLNFLRSMTWLSALLGPEAVNDSMDRIIRYALANDLVIVSIDFTSFDANTRGKIQDCTWEEIRMLFQDTSDVQDDLGLIEEIFRTVGLITPDGVIEGEHGTPSGSMFTTPVGSIAHAIVISSSGVVELDNSQILIDDGVHLVKRENLERFFDEIEKWGFVVNREKSYVEDTFSIYLQHLFHPDLTVDGKIKGVYPISRAWERYCFMENFDSFAADNIVGGDYFAIRALSIVENAKYHPAFEEFCLFLLKQENGSLVPTEDGITKYIDRLVRTEGSEGILFNKHGDDPRGIRGWRSYNFFKNLEEKGRA